MVTRLSSARLRLPQTGFLSRRASSAPSTAQPRGSRSIFFSAGLAVGSIATGYALALTLPRPPLLSLLYPIPTPFAPAANSPEGQAHADKLEQQLQALPFVKQMRSRMIAAVETTPAGTTLERGAAEVAAGAPRTELIKEYTEARPYMKGAGPHSLTGYSLRGPGK